MTLRLSFQNSSWPGQSTKNFIGCSNWDSTWRDHDTASIPEDVDPDMLKLLFKGKSLSGFETILSCACIVPGHVGAKIRRCRKILLSHSQISINLISFSGYPHSADGTLSKMVRHECEATRTIFIPEDPRIRMACVIMEPSDPHTHPILPATKATIEIKNLYRECISAAGIHGSTVRTVDNGV